MRKYAEFELNISPFLAATILREDKGVEDLTVFYDYKVSGEDDKQICVLVLEKYFYRNNSTASLTITLDNFESKSIMKCISTGNGEGIFDIGWGAGNSFIRTVRSVLSSNIVKVIQEP